MPSSHPSIAPARQQQILDFLSAHGFSGAKLHPLAGDASFRRYIRIRHASRSAMLMDAPPEKENVRPYIAVARFLHNHGYSAPAILAEDAKAGLLLLEDLGDDLFTSVLKHAFRKKAREQELYGAAIDLLAEWHRKKANIAVPAQLALPVYDQNLLMQEVRLFSDWYLPQVLGKDQAAQLKGEFQTIWRDILVRAPLMQDHWVHRDYHADNLIWLPSRKGVSRVGLLDFQDGVYGDAAYDMVSLLEDARRDVPDKLVEEMKVRYLKASGADPEHFAEAYATLGAQRNCKIIGIFVRLAARDGKSAYLDFLPRVWRHLERDLAHPALAPLATWLNEHVSPQWRGTVAVRHTSQDLALTA